MAKSRQLNDALKRLADAEAHFLSSEFLAPVLRGSQVQVRIAGVVCTLRVQPADFEGWGVFRPTSHSEATLVRQARLAERQRFLELFPLVRLLIAGRHEDDWLALPAHRGDTRFHIEGMAPVRLIEDAQLFETIHTRFDGTNFWYAGGDPRWDPATATFLRRSLDKLVPPDKLSRSALTAEERDAYAASYWPRYHASEEAKRNREEERLRGALEHAGAELKHYVERQDVYAVTFEVDGRRHTSAVAKRDLSVQVAGICLSGEDEKFDLQSLVGVIREAQGGGGLVHVGRDNRGMAEEQYWQVHPRRRRR
jgi:hypothetical protein